LNRHGLLRWQVENQILLDGMILMQSKKRGNFLEIIAFFFVDLFSLYLFFCLFKT